jgi:hypothetical protein
VPHGAAGYYLLGKICALSNRHDTAVHYYAAALTLDPLMWCAYEELCNLGAPACHTKDAEAYTDVCNGKRHRQCSNCLS